MRRGWPEHGDVALHAAAPRPRTPRNHGEGLCYYGSASSPRRNWPVPRLAELVEDVSADMTDRVSTRAVPPLGRDREGRLHSRIVCAFSTPGTPLLWICNADML